MWGRSVADLLDSALNLNTNYRKKKVYYSLFEYR